MGTNVRLMHYTLRKIFPDGLPADFWYLDLGSQNLYGGEKKDYLEFMEWAGGFSRLTQRMGELSEDLVQRSRGDWETITDGRPRATVAELAAPLGWEYHALDLSGGTLPWDLNTAVVDPPYRGHFDVVANYGTTEHVFNQANCFKLIHDATRIGGAMVHFLPASGYLYHCLFKYDPKFFLLLRQANNYEMLHAGFGSEEGAGRIDQRHHSWTNYEHVVRYEFHNFLLEFIFRRTDAAEFASPYDIVNDDPVIRFDFPQPCSSVR